MHYNYKYNTSTKICKTGKYRISLPKTEIPQNAPFSKKQYVPNMQKKEIPFL